MTYWYYIKHGQQNGPVDEDAMKGLFATGNIAPDTMVWCQDLKDWTRACDVVDLVPVEFRPPPMPSQPPPWPPRPSEPFSTGTPKHTHLPAPERNVSLPVLPRPAPDSALTAVDPIVPVDIQKKIKHAWIAGVVSGCITLLLSLLAIGGVSFLGYSAWELLDAALVFGLAYGMYRRSRTCALLMFVYFIASKCVMLAEAKSPNPGMFVGSVVWLYLYFMGIVGTFQYHKYLRTHPIDTPARV